MSVQKAFIFDINRCTGCAACQIACSIENRVDPGISWRRVHTFNPRHVSGVPTFHHSIACSHCVDPPCMKHCPALAYTKDPHTGAVTIDSVKCIGCMYCSWACPYDAPQFNAVNGTMEKCTFCTHRLDEGLEPACVTMCPTNALQFADHTQPEGPAVLGFATTEIGPAIRFVPLRDRRKQGVTIPGARAGDVTLEPVSVAASRISLSSEWTLWAFSSLAALLVGLGASAFVFESPGPAIVPTGTALSLVLLLAGAGAMVLSTAHLGRRSRAWRAVLNWRRSWLSREVLLFAAFLAVVGVSVVTGPSGSGGGVGWVAAALGFAALFTMDSVYHVTRAPGLWLHSAQVFLTGLLYACLFSANGTGFGLVAAIKTFLYLWRKYNFGRERREVRPWITRARVLIGLAAPLVMWWKGGLQWYPVVVASVIVGELIDRAEFYIELDAPSPARQMETDLVVLLEEERK